MAQTIASWVATAIVLAVAWLLPKYIERCVTEAARGAVDIAVGKSLADYKLNLDKQLEIHRRDLTAGMEGLRQALAIDRERYSRDYGLFATKRNEVYAETFALLEKARGAYASKFAKLLSYRDFSRSPKADLVNLANRLELISASERQRLNSLIESDDLDKARKLANNLNERDELRRANRTFMEFRNACTLNALYFSPAIDALLAQALRPLGMLSIFADEIIDEEEFKRGDAYPHVEKVDELTATIRNLMREEMQEGFRATKTIPGSDSRGA